MSENKPKKDDNLKTYLKFSGIAIQMAVLITLMAYLGSWIDEELELKKPIFTLVLILFAIFGSLFQIIREVIKLGKDD